jgi:7-carboxy-7-deazaguanine synthase
MSSQLVPPEVGRLRPGELLVNESFLSIQGESTHSGRPCFFIRLAACPLRCGWCDTEYAFYEGNVTTVAECVQQATASGCPLVEVTGGEPLLQKSCPALLRALSDAGLEVLLETSGAFEIDAVDPRVRRIVDWKCPGSEMADRNRPSVLAALKPGDELKLVILDRRDYEWARSFVAKFREEHPTLRDAVPIHFSPVFGRCHPADLARWILEDRTPVRLNLQLHKFIWPPEARGV